MARVQRLTADRSWLAVLLALVVGNPAWAAPEIESVSPRALRPGAPTELKLSGNALSKATNLWTSFPANVENLGEGRFRVAVLSNAPVGIGALRAYGSEGVSSVSFVLLDDLPAVIEATTNASPGAPRRIEMGSGMEGKCRELTVDKFTLKARKGERVSIEVVASRLGSRLDSVVRVTDSSGRILAQNDDAPGLRGDSFVSLTSEEGGDVLVEVRDVNYNGGAEYFYRLRMGDFALATTTFPVAAEQGGERSFQLAGPAGNVGRVQSVVLSNALVIPLAIHGRRGSTFATALATAKHEVAEREPNDRISKSNRVSLSDGINGRFDKAADRDCFEFKARKGQRLEFRAATRSAGAPADVSLEIQSAEGARLARSNPAAEDEGIVTHRFASNGNYHLIVEEVTGAFGPSHVYRIDARPAAGFGLAVDNDRFNAVAGREFEVKVTCVRGEYKGPVTLSVHTSNEALSVTNHVIGEGKTNTTLKVTAPRGPERLHFLTITGTARRDGEEIQLRASTAPALRRRFPQMLYPPADLDGAIALGVLEPQ